MERHETFYDQQEALDCQRQHPGAEITHKEGYPTILGRDMIYAIPEDQPSWTVWWEE